MAYKTIDFRDQLTCTNYVDFGKCQDRCGQFCWSKKDSNYVDVKVNGFRKDDNKEFRRLQKITLGEADFSQFLRLRDQLIIAAENLYTITSQKHG